MSPRAGVIRLSTTSLSWDDCRLLVESVVDYAIFMLDVEGHVATWNLGAERIKGYKANEIVGQHFSKFYPPEAIAAGLPESELKTAAGLGRSEDEGWRIRKDGSRFWANVIITALRDENGELRGFAKVTRDLTQARMAAEELRQSEERFHHLVDAVADYAIFMLDPTGHVATWNVGARKTKGYEPEEIIGKHFSTFYTPEDRAQGKPERVLDIVRREGRYEEDSWRVRKDGTLFWATVVITALRNERGDLLGFGKVTRDLTARREALLTERELFEEQAARAAAEEVADRAEQANRVKDEFLATVSHELRTPLSAIVGWAAILRHRQLEPSIAKAIEAIDRNAQAQVKIIEDILDVSRIIAGKLRLQPRPTDLVSVANDAIDVILPSASAKEISVAFEAPPEGCLLVADPERLQQVAWNLLSNAVKFTDRNGSIRLGIQCHPTHVVLTVTDTGKGIEPEFLPYVFDRFKQADASTTRRFGGLGLGLALVRHLVELHGGTVAAESSGPGEGSTFTVTLPVQAAVPAIPRDRSVVPGRRRAVAEPHALEAVRILVVDDDADARDILAEVLANAGAIVERSGSAAEGFEALLRFRPHVLVSDIGMAEQDGYALIRRVRALDISEGGGIPSIALTAYTRAEDRTKALAAGFTTHIGKPVNPEDLFAAVANLAAFTRR